MIPPADSLAGIFQAAGIQDIREYYYWDDKQRGVCLEKLLEDLEKAPEQSVVVLSASAHYPTGADLSQNEWAVITKLIVVTDVYICALSQRLKLLFTDKWLLTPTEIICCLVTLSTEAEAFPLPPAACSGTLLWRFRAGLLACAVLCIAGDGVPLCAVVLPLLRTIW